MVIPVVIRASSANSVGSLRKPTEPYALKALSFPSRDLKAPHIFGTFASLGGDDGIRTHDPLLAGQVLSQLSYTPI